MAAFPFEGAIAPVLKQHGFRKAGRTWHKGGADTILVVNLQKSQWGDTLYVNLGIYLRALGREASPPERRCHIQTRLDTLVPEHLGAAVRSLTASGQHEAAAMSAFSDHGLAWLEVHATLPAIRRFIASPLARKMLVFRRIHEHFRTPGSGIEEPRDTGA